MARRKKAGTRRSARGAQKLITLSEIHRKTGIAMATLAKYARQSPRKFPSEGRGRRRRYYPAAMSAFQQMRSQSRRGPKPGGQRGGAAAGLAGRQLSQVGIQLRRLQRRTRNIERSLRRLERLARKPVRIRAV